ncbi:MAG: hypothetical protein ACFBRM_15475 [Pikeienuella sp.]
MAQLEARLRDFVEPLRNHAVGTLLQAIAEAIEQGAEVEPEPVLRDAEGRVVRSGPLSLPRRGDVAVTRAGRRLIRRVEGGGLDSFEPMTLVADGGFTTVLAPFPWEEATLIVETVQPKPDWGPFRLWFLEWFQPRMSDVAPDLDGVVHAVEGPWPAGGAYRIGVDFGSAPTAAVAGLIAAVGQSGALRLRIGGMP